MTKQRCRDRMAAGIDRLRWVALGLLALIVAGCAGRDAGLENQPPSPELLNQAMREAWAQMDSLDARITFRVESGEFTGSLFGTLKMRSPDALSLSLKAPFGIPVGDLIVSDGRYEATMGNGRFETGAVEEFDLETMTGLPIPSRDVLRIFEPLARPQPGDGDLDSQTLGFEVTGEDSLWQWRLADEELEHHILFDPAAPRVIEERWVDRASGRPILVKSYEDPRSMQGVPVARRLAVQSGGAYPTVVNIRFDDLELNPEWTSDPFQRRSNDG